MGSSKYHRLADVLLQIEAAMRQQSMWSEQQPERWRLESIQPFCIDTLSFQQWLQYIFLVRMKEIIETGQQLPSCCDIAPMASESFKQLEQHTDGIVHLLIECDQIIAS
ncbi:MAG: YqcC family protein [Cycloclasticus sp.]|nr:YqcC family protein [Cycloclasticus sp.]MBQ0789359.1 YqcC family protein [Cycloclasticus sp.]